MTPDINSMRRIEDCTDAEGWQLRLERGKCYGDTFVALLVVGGFKGIHWLPVILEYKWWRWN